jgi:hypothetical protein
MKLFENIRLLLVTARQNVYRKVNITMVKTYFEIGKMIVEDEQGSERRAEYGIGQLKELGKKLTVEFGKGFSERNLENMRNFYLIYSKSQTVSAKSGKSEAVSQKFELSWSHYVFLMRLEEPIRRFYEIEAVQNNWNTSLC